MPRLMRGFLMYLNHPLKLDRININCFSMREVRNKMKKSIILFILIITIVLSGCMARSCSQNTKQILPEVSDPVAMKTNENATFSEIPFFFTEDKDKYGFIIRTYYDSETPIAESFGYKINDYYIDFDRDGVKELLCNCEYGVDGHREVYVFKIGKPSLKGQYVFNIEDLPGLNYWGVNAVQTFYDPLENAIIVSYYDTIREEDILLPLQDFESFIFGEY